MTDLSIIIVSFNTKPITERCLKSLRFNLVRYPINYEVIAVDNGSTDGSAQLLKTMKQSWPNLKIILSKKNLGFGRGNNLGLKLARGKYILYLNSDAIITDVDFNDLVNLFKIRPGVGALTVKVVLSNGKIDPASHRGFPTPWTSLTYFLGLERLFANVIFLNKVFGHYHLVDLNLDTIHEIEVPTGAFLMVRHKIVKKIGGFDTDYFAYGEDVEMAYQIGVAGFKILYYPLWSVLHLKSVSGLKKKTDPRLRAKIRQHFYNAMKIFYRKHYEKKYPWIINQLIYSAIDFKNKFLS
jgi:hypothetical protein